MENLLRPEFITVVLFAGAVIIYFFEFKKPEGKSWIMQLFSKLKKGMLIFLILEMFYFSFAVDTVIEGSIFFKDKLLSFCIMLFFIYSYFALKDTKKGECSKQNETANLNTPDAQQQSNDSEKA